MPHKNLTKKILAASIGLALTSQVVLAKEEQKSWSVNEPQGVFKNAEINVTTGTWMSVDVSPDGKTIVFDLLGDIYTMPITGGKAKALMTDIAWQMQPRFSPDGKHIVFTSDQGGGDNLWVMDTDGSNAKAVTNETFRLLNSPAWSPDGNYIVGRKHYTGTRSLGAGEVWMYHKTGGKGAMLTKRPNEQKDLGEPAFSPDGRYVYFSQDSTPGKYFEYSKDSEKGIYRIKRYDLETGDIETIISGKGGAIRPVPSPDGKLLAFISRDDFQTNLYTYDLKSGEEKLIYSGLDRDMQETWAIHGVYPNMAWLPDNSGMVFWTGGKIHKLDIKSGKAQVIPFEVNTTKKIQTALRFEQNLDVDTFDTKMLRDVEISPDGKKVIFESMGRLYVQSLKNGKASGKAKLLTKNKGFVEFNPQFSRDGKSIVYATWDDKKFGSLKVVSSRGGKSKTITNEPGKYVEPTFSPDGKTIVYRKVQTGSILNPKWGLNTGVYQIPAKGGEPQLITKSGYQPHFGDRNDRIFLTKYGKKTKLVKIDLDGQNEAPLYQGEFATEYHVAPDGKHLAFAERFKVFVTPFVERGAVIDTGPKASNFPVKQLSVRAGEGLNWNGKSDQLYWNLGPELYQASVAKLFDFDNDQDKEVTPIETSLSFKQDIDKPEGVVAFVGGTVVTMEGDQVIENGVVVVKDNKIIAIGEKGKVDIPRKAKTYDITGKSIIPGLIDAHAHGPQGTSGIVPEQNWENYAGLSLGVTTIHDPSNDTATFFAASEMQKAGKIVAPRLFSTGRILYGAKSTFATSHVDKLDDAKFHVERLAKVGAFSVKSYNQPRRNQRQQFVQAAREAGVMVVPEGGSLFQHNMTMIVDGHTTLEHSIPTEKIYDDVKQLWSNSAMAYTPTMGVSYGGISGEHYWYDVTDVWKHPILSKYVPSEILDPRSMRRTKAPLHHYNHFNVAKGAKEIQDLGILVNSGGHGQREGLAMHWEIWMMAQGGMSPLEALKTATIDPAKSFGMDKNIGSLKTGKLADLVVVDGDITKDIRVSDKVVYTMVNGRLYDANTMNEIGNYDNKRAKFYFEK